MQDRTLRVFAASGCNACSLGVTERLPLVSERRPDSSLTRSGTVVLSSWVHHWATIVLLLLRIAVEVNQRQPLGPAIVKARLRGSSGLVSHQILAPNPYDSLKGSSYAFAPSRAGAFEAQGGQHAVNVSAS